MKLNASAKPINGVGVNSIEAVGIVVSFSRKLTQGEIDRLLGLESFLKDQLPVFSKLQEFGVTVENNQVKAQSSEFKGVVLQKLSEVPGKIDWVVQVSEDSLQVTCGKYDRWKFVLPKALEYIQAVYRFLDLDSLSINAIGCQFIDKFVYEGNPETYNLGDVFDVESKFLPRNIKESNDLWHVHQGWFGQISALTNAKAINQLNLTSSLINERLTAVIDHITHIMLGKPISVKSLLEIKEIDVTLMAKVLTEIHDSNKGILKKLLSENKKKEIGLVL